MSRTTRRALAALALGVALADAPASQAATIVLDSVTGADYEGVGDGWFFAGGPGIPPDGTGDADGQNLAVGLQAGVVELRGVAEFSLAALAGVDPSKIVSATITYKIDDVLSGFGPGTTFDGSASDPIEVYAYSADGEVVAADFAPAGMTLLDSVATGVITDATLMTTGAVPFQVDATAALQALLAGSATHMGVLFDTADTPTGASLDVDPMTSVPGAQFPFITVAVFDEIDWGFRDNFRSYVYAGTGAPPITASAGAICDPNPDPMRGGCDPKIGTHYGVFGWTETSSSFTLPSGAGTITGQGTVVFDRPDHLFTLSIIDPIITVDSAGDAIVNTHIVLETTLPGTSPVDERMDFGAFELTNLQVTATTVTWDLGNGMITDEAAGALGSFLPAGSALDPIRIILPVPVATPTPLASTRILLKDNVANADKRSMKIIVTKQPAIVGAGFDPMAHGAFVRVLGDGFEDGYVLPAQNWGALLRGGAVAGWKYSDKERANGPIFSALLKNGVLKVIGKGAGLGHSLATEPANLTVVFESGITIDYFCLGVGAASKTAFKADKLYKATKNPAPASCPAYVPY